MASDISTSRIKWPNLIESRRRLGNIKKLRGCCTDVRACGGMGPELHYLTVPLVAILFVGVTSKYLATGDILKCADICITIWIFRSYIFIYLLSYLELTTTNINGPLYLQNLCLQWALISIESTTHDLKLIK